MKKALLESLKQINRTKAQKLTSVGKPTQQKLQEKPAIKRQISRSQSIKSSSSASVIASNTLFKNINFCFPINDIDLNKRITDILTKRIIKHGGKMFKLGDNMKLTEAYYYLVSPLQLKNKLTEVIQKQNLYFSCLNYHYINDCLSEDSLLSEHDYFLNKLKEKNERKTQNLKNETPKKRPGNKQEDSSLGSSNKKIQKQENKSSKKKPRAQLLEELMEINSSMSQQTPVVTQLGPLIDLDNSRRKRNQQCWNIKKDKFLCQKGSNSKPDLNVKENNLMIIEELKKLQKIYEIEKDKGRVIAYSRAVSTIKGLDFDIKNVKDVDGIEGIGKKLKDKIKELLETGKLTKVQNLQKNQKYSISEQLQRVWGIGPTKAVQLYNKGIRSIEQLRKHEDLLTKNQRLGLKYLQQIEQRIPRQQVAIVEELVKKAIFELVGSKLLHKVQACGSYRRGKQTCGDIDIIITRIDGVFEKDLLVKLIDKLQSTGLITDNLTMPREHKNEQTCLNYMGICQLQGKPHRRIDIKYYHYQQFAFALLHFTGSDVFNRSLRLFARKKGYSLSDHRLVPVDKDGKDKKQEGNKIICFEEKDIFDFLGVSYKEPKDRDIY